MADEGKKPLTSQDECKRWQNRIALALRYQEKKGNTDERWDKNIRALAGDFGSAVDIGEDAIDVNMVRSSVKTALPPLWVNEPYITVRATTPRYKNQDNVRRAEYAEAEINYWLRELKVRHQVRKAIIDGEATNHGYIYVGYIKDKEDVEVDGERVENSPLIRHKQPFVRRMCPKHILVPPGYWDLEDCPWVGLYFPKPLDQVKARYPIAEEKDLKPSKAVGEAKDYQDDSEIRNYLDSDDAKLVELVQIINKADDKVYTIAIGFDDFLEDPAPLPYKVEGFPLEHYRPEEISDEYYGTPPVTYYLPQNIELNITRTAMKRRRERTKAVVWVDSEIAKEVKEQYANAKDGEIIPVDTGGDDIRKKIIVDAGLPFDKGDLAYDAVIKADIREETGLGAEQRGSGDPDIDSATASANVEKHAQIRSSDRGDRVRDIYIGISKKLLMILRQMPDQERTRLIAGPTAAIMTELKYSTSELEGEFAFDMDYSAMLSDNPATRQAQSMLRYNMFRADPLVNPEALILDVYKSQNIANPQTALLFLRSPSEEGEMMLRGLPVESHERDEHQEHVKQHVQQANMLFQSLRRIMDKNSAQGMKVRLAMLLTESHIQDHYMKLEKLTGQKPKPPGSPVAENMLRNQMRVVKGGETAAEITGQPLTAESMVQ